MSRQRTPRTILNQVVRELESELESPDLSPMRRKVVLRQLLEAGLGLARLDRHEHEAERWSAESPAPDPADPTPAKPEGEDALASLGKPTPAPAEKDGWPPNWLTTTPIRGPKRQAPAPVIADEKPRPEAVPPSTSTPAVVRKTDEPSKPAPAPKTDEHDPMPRHLWSRGTFIATRSDIPGLCADFRAGLQGNTKAVERLRNAPYLSRADSFQSRLSLLFSWFQRHPEIDPASVSLPGERPWDNFVGIDGREITRRMIDSQRAQPDPKPSGRDEMTGL